MPGPSRVSFFQPLLAGASLVLGLLGCSASQPVAAVPAAPVKLAPAKPAPLAPPTSPASPVAASPAAPETIPGVMLGIDVLEAQGFAAVKGNVSDCSRIPRA